MSGFGLFVALFGGVMGWAGWHNYSVWDVIGGVISGKHVTATGATADGKDHTGGAGLKHLVSLNLSAVPGGSALKDVGGAVGGVAGAGAAVASGGAIVPAPVQNFFDKLVGKL